MKRQRATWAMLFAAMSAGACPSRDDWRDRGPPPSAPAARGSEFAVRNANCAMGR